MELGFHFGPRRKDGIWKGWNNWLKMLGYKQPCHVVKLVASFFSLGLSMLGSLPNYLFPWFVIRGKPFI